MSLFQQLSVLCVRQVLGERADSLLRFLGERYNDHSARLEAAFSRSGDRAWRCLEVTLVGESWWATLKTTLSPRDEQTLQSQIRAFLKAIPPADLPDDADAFRKLALAELRAARKAGLVPGAGVPAQVVAEDHARAFARYGDPNSLIQQEREMLDGVSGALARSGYPNLARFVGLRPADGQPLLAQAARYFFRREVEADERLANGLTMEKLDGLDGGMKLGFDGLNDALAAHGDKLDGLLAATLGVGEKVTTTMELVAGTRDEVKALQSRMDQQNAEMRDLTALLKQLLHQQGEKAPAEVGQLLEVARAAPIEDQTPEVRRVAARLTMAAQQLEATRRKFERLGELTVPELPPSPPPKKKSGRMISTIFDSVETPEPAPPRQEPTRRRLISPLFDTPPGGAS